MYVVSLAALFEIGNVWFWNLMLVLAVWVKHVIYLQLC